MSMCHCGCADIDKLVAAAQSFEALVTAQAPARPVNRPTAAQELYSEQAALGQQGTAEPMGKESRQIRQQAAQQQPTMPRKRPLLEQPAECWHRDKRRHREPHRPQAPISGRKRLLDEEADSRHCKVARLNTATWPRSQHGLASVPASETGFTMGLLPRKDEQTRPDYRDGSPRKNLKGTKQGALGFSMNTAATRWYCGDRPAYCLCRLQLLRLHA